jgi:hypothetical protein
MESCCAGGRLGGEGESDMSEAHTTSKDKPSRTYLFTSSCFSFLGALVCAWISFAIIDGVPVWVAVTFKSVFLISAMRFVYAGERSFEKIGAVR